MPAVASRIPTLSDVRAWDIEHLTAAADFWTKTATVWEDSFTELVRRMGSPGGVPWEGEAAEAAHQLAYSDKMTVIGLADQLHHAAAIARAGARDIEQAKWAVLRVVNAAEGVGFNVGEDFSVADPNYYDVVTAAVRQGEAEAFATELRATVGALMAADTSVAGSLLAATAGLGADVFSKSGHGGNTPNGSEDAAKGVHALHYWKTPPKAPAPSPGPEPGMGGNPSPVTALGLPDYRPATLSDVETRTVYAEGELRMKALDDQMARQGLSVKERAEALSRIRSELRSWTRDLMHDREAARWLAEHEKNPTFSDLVARNQAKGLTGDSVYQAIIDSSTRSRPSVNQNLGIDPAKPPPLPAVREAPASTPVPRLPGEAPPATAARPLPQTPTAEGLPPRVGGLRVGGAPLPDDAMPHIVDLPGHRAGAPDLPILGDGIPDEEPG